MANTHTADAAGGEAIYSSDGLSPLPVPPPPSLTNRNVKQTIENDTLDSESTDAIRAFEVFSGKVFQPPRNRSSTTTTTTNTTTTNNNFNDSNGRRSTRGGEESRLERLARIQAELDEMEDEDAHLNNSLENNGEEEIRGVVKDLSDRLRILQSGADVSKRQQDLTAIVNKLEINEGESQGPQQEPSKQIGPGLTHGLGHGHGYGLTHQQRLLRIEKFLGSQINASSGSDTSILERLKQAEGKLNSVDEKTLNQAASRAKVIRADLEAAAKARSKINNINVEDGAKIAKLHGQLVDMDGFLSSNILATIVNRLATCATLHSQSMDFGKDLKALESMVKDVEVTLGSVEESVKGVESGLMENMKVIQKNMERLDQN